MFDCSLSNPKGEALTGSSSGHNFEDESQHCNTAKDSSKHILQQTLDGRAIPANDQRLKKWFTLDGKTVTIPGQGSITSPICGKFNFAIACPNKDSKPSIILHNCHNINCPVCYHWNVNQQARRITERLNGLDQAYKCIGKNVGRDKHIVVSQPPEKWTPAMILKDNGKAFRRQARKFMKKNAKNGFWGGVEILHCYRKKHLDGSECEEHDCQKEHIWVWGPHIHYIVHGFFTQTDKMINPNGWFFKNIKASNYRDVYATAYYLLTHSAVFNQTYLIQEYYGYVLNNPIQETGSEGQGYSYVGEYANNKGAVVTTGQHTEQVPCSCCGAALHRYDRQENNEEPDYDRELGEHSVRVLERAAYLLFRCTSRLDDGSIKVFFERGPLIPLEDEYEDS